MDILHTVKHPATGALIRSAGSDDTNICNIGALERYADMDRRVLHSAVSSQYIVKE